MTRSIFHSTLFSILMIPFLLTSPALAGGERVWELAGYDELSRGELQQTVLSDKGEILAGFATEKIDIDAIGLIWSAARAKDGTLYLGTAYDGRIYRVDGNKAHLIATTDNLVVTDMVFDKNGSLLASTIPSPTVWKIDTPKKIDPKAPEKAKAYLTLAALADAEAEPMIWTLAMDNTSQTLYMGTGPDGQIWAAGNDGRAELYLNTEEKHFLDIVPYSDGIYAGTSPNALLIKATAPGVSFAVADFEGTEVKSIVQMSDNALAVAVNDFTYPRTAPASSAKSGIAAKVASTVSNAVNTGTSSTKTSSKDKGFVYRVDTTGSQELLFEKHGTHITTVAVSDDDTIWAAMGDEGKIFSVTKDRITYEAADLAEREVMCLMADQTLSFAATGDTGAAYVFSSQDTEHIYLSPVLDAEAVSSFGKASWIANGALNVTARSGNTITPDANWTDWRAPLTNGAISNIENARYAQLRFEWGSRSTVLLQFELFYKPNNRRAVISSFDPDTPFANTNGASKGEAGTSERTVVLRPDKGNRKELSLSWKVHNPDGDTLRYRLYYKPVNKTLWIPIFTEDERFTKTRYTFETDTVPEGRYHFKLTAEDSIENPAGDVLDDETISVPVDIDNHPPEITDLTFRKRNNEVAGSTTDSFSPIAALDYAVDGGIWKPVAAVDKLLDNATEAFRFKIEPRLTKGGHVIALRATDRQGNYTVRELHTEITE